MSRQNGITVEDMLKLDIMKGCKLVAGFKGIRNTISRVNIMADPEIMEWIHEGEFLLTTAYFFEKEHDIKAQKELLNVCYNKKLAGIGIKVSPYLNELPPEIIILANKLNLPIIDIHQSIPLADIMMSTFKEIFNKQASLLERIEHLHEKLMAVMMEGKGVNEIVRVVHENIRNPAILVMNFSDETIEHLYDKDIEIKSELLKEINDFYAPNNIKNKVKRLDEDKVLINGKYIKRMVMPIIIRDNIYGHLFSWATNMPLGGFDLAIIESASTTIGLSLLQDLSVKEVEIRYRSEFFEDLISLDAKRKKKALDRARFFNLNPDNKYLIEVISCRMIWDLHDEDEEESINYIRDFVNTIVPSIEELVVYLKLEGLVSTKVNGMQILLGFENEKSTMKKLDEFNNRLMEILNKKSKSIEFKMGVGRIYPGLENVNKSFLDALRAVRIGKSISNKEIVTFDELGIFKILSQDFLNEELEDFYNTTLKPLVDYDEKKSTELVKTLEIFFKNTGNLTRISEQLFAHYNTVLYRINRINEITGMSLEDPNHRLNLEIALKIKDLLDK
ncbi:MAG: PucR family transcriptional regulator [Tissierellia bacterium]|nr:PucR family transcriptional regulator [Tissierellia bacterium]